MDKPIKILFLAANPKDTSQLRLDEEMRGIDQALRQSEFRDKFDIKQHWAVRVGDLQSYLLRYKPDIVHFSGHGSASNEIILEDINGNSQPVASIALSQLFSILKDNIRCVVLNACYSDQQAQAIAKHIDCVIGMSKAIGDSAAISFAVALYQALGYGRDIKTAFDLGRLQINLESLNEQDTPKLLASNCAPHEIVFVGSEPNSEVTKRTNILSRKTHYGGMRLERMLIVFSVALLLLVIMLIPGFRHLVLPSSEAEQHRLAVLPFRAIGEDPVNEPFSQGLLYTVTNILTRMEQFQEAVQVVPANEVLDEGITNTREATSTFGIDIAITGNIERTGESVSLTLNLVDAASRTVLNSRTIYTHPANLLAFQDEAVSKLNELLELELSPESVQILKAGGTRVPGAYEFYLQGQGYLQRFTNEAEVDAAISLFERAIAEDTSYALAHAGLSEAYLRKYEHTWDKTWIDKAFLHGERAIALDNRLAPTHVVSGMHCNTKGNYEKAIVEFYRALRLEPGDAAAYRGLAKAYEGLNKLDLAEKSYKKAIELKPGYWAGYNDLGIFYAREGRHKEAAEQFRHVTELAPDNAWAYNNLGAQYQNMERLDEAILWYRRATEINSGEVDAKAMAYSNLAGIYYSRENFSEAIQMYTKALALKENTLWGWHMLANSYFYAGDNNNARVAWKRAISFAEERLEVNPSHTEALKILAGAHAMLGQREQALAAIGHLLASNRKDPKLLEMIGMTYEILGERNLALRYIEDALKSGLAPTSLKASKWLSDLRTDPRYQELIKPYTSGE